MFRKKEQTSSGVPVEAEMLKASGTDSDLHDVGDDAPELVEEAHHVHRLVDLEGLLGAVGRPPTCLSPWP